MHKERCRVLVGYHSLDQDQVISAAAKTVHHDEELLLSLLVVSDNSVLLRVHFREESLIGRDLLGPEHPRGSVCPDEALLKHERHLRAFSALTSPAFDHFAIFASGRVELCDRYCINLTLLGYLSPCLVRDGHVPLPNFKVNHHAVVLANDCLRDSPMVVLESLVRIELTLQVLAELIVIFVY